jgi:hypothetical protein
MKAHPLRAAPRSERDFSTIKRIFIEQIRFWAMLTDLSPVLD